jgi:hypothetical protein
MIPILCGCRATAANDPMAPPAVAEPAFLGDVVKGAVTIVFE